MYVLPRLLRRYRRLHPDVDLRVSSGSSEAILGKLRGHEMDLALLTLPVIAKDLEVVPVLKEEMVVVTAPRHPLAHKRVVDAREIGKFPLILYETGSRTRETIENFLREENVPADIAMETENAEIIKAMVASGIGITVLSHAAVALRLAAQAPGLCPDPRPKALSRDRMGLSQIGLRSAHRYGDASRLRADARGVHQQASSRPLTRCQATRVPDPQRAGRRSVPTRGVRRDRLGSLPWRRGEKKRLSERKEDLPHGSGHRTSRNSSPRRPGTTVFSVLS